MATLTQVSITTRKIIRYSIYFVVFLIFLRITFNAGTGLFRYFFPAPPPAPTVIFGRLPNIPFPDNDTPQYQYKIETPQGTLPNFGGQAIVYFMPKLSSGLLSLDNSTAKARGLGFTSLPKEQTETLYTFENPRSPATLTMNIITEIFSVDYDLSFDPIPVTFPPPAPDIATSISQSFLNKGGLLATDLTGPVTHEFLKIEAQQLIPAISLSEANLVKVNLYRMSYNQLPSVTPTSIEANVWFLISGSRDANSQIISGEYHYFPIDQNQAATYPIKSTQDATNELINGQGYIANTGSDQTGLTTIRDIYLAYYDPDTETQFYQPVYVFVGDKGFTAYVPAISPEYYGE